MSWSKTKSTKSELDACNIVNFSLSSSERLFFFSIDLVVSSITQRATVIDREDNSCWIIDKSVTIGPSSKNNLAMTLAVQTYKELRFNKKIRSTGVSPSYEEMKNSLNLKSKSGIHRLISALEERGFIKRLAHKARALEVVKLPENASAHDLFNSFTPSVIKGGLDKNSGKSSKISVLGSIAAGTPIEAIQQEVDKVNLPADFNKNEDHFGWKVKGDSMIEAGINDGDTVIIKKSSNADNGQIAVVLIDNEEATLKRIRKKGNTIALESANKKYGTKIYAAKRIKIQGKLVSLYRNFN